MTRLIILMTLLVVLTPAWPHSASDAYLSVTALAGGKSGPRTLSGEWDIALRDLDFVLGLDENGDGQVTWGETRRRQTAIERYAYDQLKFSDQAGTACSIKPLRLLIDGHADGAYAALFFDVLCAQAPTSLRLKYSLFFGIDPSHRGIFVFRQGDGTSTALFSPQSAEILLPLRH